MTVSVVAGKPSVAVGDPGIALSPIASAMRLQFTGTDVDSVRNALKDAFGPFPIRLSVQNDKDVVRGMVAAAGGGNKPYNQILIALNQFGNLELTEVL
jgi:hypothetical protein